jgi:hypothetical protein
MNNKTAKLLRKRQEGANLTKEQKAIFKQFTKEQREEIRKSLLEQK